jgi:hypothetical protein
LRQASDDVAELAAERSRRAKFTSTERLADRLHYLIHFAADCDFYYSDWPIPTGCRSQFYELARQIEEWYADDEGHAAGDRTLGQMIAMIELVRFGKVRG